MGDHHAWSMRRADVGGPRRTVRPTAIVEIELNDAAPSVVRRRGPRRRRRIALGVAASALVVAVWARPHPEEGSDGRLPTEIHLQWSTELAVNQVAAVATDGDTVVAQLNWDRQLVALDLSTGATRWTTEAPASQLAELEIVGEVVIVLQAGASELTAFDVGTGDFVWSRPTDSAIVDPDRVLALRWDPSSGSVSRVERVDARSGRTSAVVEGSDLVVGADTITARSGDRLRAYDAGTFDQLAEIDVTDLEGRVLSTARITDGFVVATSSRVGVADQAGALVSVVDLPGEDEDFPDVTLVPAGDHDLFAAVRFGSLSMVRVAGDQIEVLWHRRGHFAGATEAEGGLVAVLATPEVEDVRRRRSPGVHLDPRSRPVSAVVDAVTGTVRWQIDELEPWLDPIVSNGADPPLTSTGLLTFTHTSSNARPAGTLRGLDLGGTPMWELELPLLVDLRIGHDALLTFELDTSAARVRISRWG